MAPISPSEARRLIEDIKETLALMTSFRNILVVRRRISCIEKELEALVVV